MSLPQRGSDLVAPTKKGGFFEKRRSPCDKRNSHAPTAKEMKVYV